MHPQFTPIIEDWYRKEGRDLPWRHTKDPYLIWVSEIILQQTQVAQGLDYYLRFVERFPDVKKLAVADEDEVLRYWQGLGYYSRARNMHKAAHQIAELGGFPSDYASIRSLSGIGDYTAAAIASFAFDLPFACIDGNVYRVLSRYFGIETPIDTTGGKHLFRALADDCLDTSSPGLYNQAIMDFGALQCTPKSPRCEVCPLVESCCAFREGLVHNLPQKEHKVKVRNRYFACICIRCQGQYLIRKRGAGDIWQGLYEYPLVEFSKKPSLKSVKSVDSVDFSLVNGASLIMTNKGVKHQLSHQLLHVDFYLLDCKVKPDAEGLWVDFADLGQYAMPRLMHYANGDDVR